MLLEACRDDPARFQEEVLGRRLWAKQVEVCQAIARSPITVVPAGRAVGKSFLLAGTVLWWLYTRPGSLVITTGPDHGKDWSVRVEGAPTCSMRFLMTFTYADQG